MKDELSETQKALEIELWDYLQNNPVLFNLRIFVGLAERAGKHYEMNDVIYVVKNSSLITLNSYERELVIATAKKPAEPPKAKPCSCNVTRPAYGSVSDTIREGMKEIERKNISIQEWLEQHPEINRGTFKTVCGQKFWEKHYAYTERGLRIIEGKKRKAELAKQETTKTVVVETSVTVQPTQQPSQKYNFYAYKRRVLSKPKPEPLNKTKTELDLRTESLLKIKGDNEKLKAEVKELLERVENYKRVFTELKALLA